ncbi:MAG: ABC transporter ATP-binding protein [Nitrososphaerota archaeon]|nr:ABC transporter ATP-binding protein [Nitrososphaerota archaeon]
MYQCERLARGERLAEFGENIIEIQGLSKVYATRNQKKVVAFRDVSLDIKRHEFVSLLGPSGCGKTTVLNVIAGLIPSTTGSVKLEGKEVKQPMRDVGFVFQQPTLLQWRNVMDNVLFPIEMLHRNRRDYEKRALQLLELVGIEEFRSHFPYQLSGGMQQRAAICRALIHDPSILLMDEPFAALDALTREFMNNELQDLWMNERKTVILVSHSIPETVYLSDRVVIMSERPGTIVGIEKIDMPRPRSADMRDSEEFTVHSRRLRSLLLQNSPSLSMGRRKNVSIVTD